MQRPSGLPCSVAHSSRRFLACCFALRGVLFACFLACCGAPQFCMQLARFSAGWLAFGTLSYMSSHAVCRVFFSCGWHLSSYAIACHSRAHGVCTVWHAESMLSCVPSHTIFRLACMLLFIRGSALLSLTWPCRAPRGPSFLCCSRWAPAALCTTRCPVPAWRYLWDVEHRQLHGLSP